MTGRLMILTTTFAVAAALVSTIVLEPLPLYIWNASASVPIGLYTVRSEKRFHVAELVAVQPPEPLATFLDLNSYLPVGVPMLKRVLALPGRRSAETGSQFPSMKLRSARRAIATDAVGRRRNGRVAPSSATPSSFS